MSFHTYMVAPICQVIKPSSEQVGIAAIHPDFCAAMPLSLMEYAGRIPLQPHELFGSLCEVGLSRHGLTCLAITLGSPVQIPWTNQFSYPKVLQCSSGGCSVSSVIVPLVFEHRPNNASILVGKCHSRDVRVTPLD